MRVSFLVYGVLYVAIEIVGNQLEKVGWPKITPLDVAEALTNALLAIVVCIALVVAVDLGRERWGPALRAWHEERLRLAAEAARGGLGRGRLGRRADRRPVVASRAARAARRRAERGAAGTYYTPSTPAPRSPRNRAGSSDAAASAGQARGPVAEVVRGERRRGVAEQAGRGRSPCPRRCRRRPACRPARGRGRRCTGRRRRAGPRGPAPWGRRPRRPRSGRSGRGRRPSTSCSSPACRSATRPTFRRTEAARCACPRLFLQSRVPSAP